MLRSRMQCNRLPEQILLFAGLVFLAVSGWKVARYAAFQCKPEVFLQLSSASPPHSFLAGKLEIPRLKMSVAIVEGENEESLSLGAGHVTGTAAFGATGNAVIAGHRDSAFYALRNVKIGDHILIRASHDFTYRVINVHIVEPDDLSVLDGDASAKLTLITCYPFSYVGLAPKRYIVEARLVPGPVSPSPFAIPRRRL
jgi:sortase A